MNAKSLGAFSLAMMNVAIVGSVQMMTACATYGFSLIFFYLVAAILFFIPCIFVTKELAIRYPITGGAFIWVEHAFGKNMGFFAVCLQWLANLIWYPTIFSFIVAGIAFLYKPELMNDKQFMITGVLVIFWLITLFNCFGIRVSSLISTVGSLVGIMLPIFLIIGLAIAWLATGKPSQIGFTGRDFLPDLVHMANWAFLIQVLISMSGIEMSAVHAGDVRNPKRDFPKALFYSAFIILIILMGSALAVAIILPKHDIHLVTGLFDAFHLFFTDMNMPYLLPIVGALVIIGNFGNVSAWMISSTRAMHVGCMRCHLPAYFQATNRFKAPVGILILEAIVFSALCVVFMLLPSVNASYWTLLDLASQVALIYYIFVFSAALVLRSRFERQRSHFDLAAIVGGLTSLAAIGVGFMPPGDLSVGNTYLFQLVLGIGILIVLIIPALLLFMASPEMKK